jgi:hypothetical protein
MEFEFYLWRWAENDLPGLPIDTYRALLAGVMPLQLEPFNAQAIRLHLARMAEHWRGRRLELNVSECADNDRCRFIHISGSDRRISKLRENIQAAGAAEWLTVYEPLTNRLHGTPKFNWLTFEDGDDFLDVDEAALLAGFEQLDFESSKSWLIFEDQSASWFSVFAGKTGYRVEWRSQRRLHWEEFKQWAVGKPPKTRMNIEFGDAERYLVIRKNEILTRSEVHVLLTAFFRGERRPAGYTWRRINPRSETGRIDINEHLL